ncbi:MAG: 30S ribosomal protein S12 methylthiotransferase RimO, partial [Candidatus Omnitrophica bacterium]|nr:30S ribosomal protein S12 methylthiotransferase RimO [Candidatus Omnitrophota bacterium]
MAKPTVYLLSLGCARNLVDSEIILGKLKDTFLIKDQPKGVDLAIINTCAFIKEAKEESLEEIWDLIELKRKGEIKKLWVVGCLPQRYREEMQSELPEVDGFLGVEAGKNGLEEMLKNLQVPVKKDLCTSLSPRFRLTPSHYTYIKLSEGCDNLCSYCAISQIRGYLRSRPKQE